MNFFRLIFGLNSIVVLVVTSAAGGIHLGNDDVTFVVNDTRLCLGGVTLDGGIIKVVGEGAIYTTDPDDEADTGAPIACNNTKFLYIDGGVVNESFSVGGSVTTTGESIGIVCGDNQLCTVQEGLISFNITAQGATSSPTLVQGSGSLTALKIEAGKQIDLSWLGVLNVPIYATGDRPTLSLKNNLTLAPGVGFFADNAAHTTLVKFNGNCLFMGGGIFGPSIITNNQEWENASVELTGPVNLAVGKSIIFTTDGARIQGNGNVFTFSDGAASFDNDNNDVTLTNIVLTGMSSASLVGDGLWQLQEVSFTQENQTMLVSGEIASGADVFTGDTTFNASTIKLKSPYSPTGTLTFAEESYLNGDGYSWDFSSTGTISLLAPLHLSAISLLNLAEGSLSNPDDNSLFLSNVIVVDSCNSSMVRFSGLSGEKIGAELIPVNGRFFCLPDTSFVTIKNAVIDLLSDCMVHARWKCDGRVEIDGNGFELNVCAASFEVSSGSHLYLSNMRLKNLGEDEFHHSFGNFPGTIHLSNVVVDLNSADVDLSNSSVNLQIDGPVTVITKNNTFFMPGNGSGTTLLNGITVYYDTAGYEDRANLRGGSGSGRIIPITQQLLTTCNVVASDAYLIRNEYLAPLIGDDVAHARTLVFNSGTTFNGLDRLLDFPSSLAAVVTIADSTAVTFTNILLNGLMMEHIALGGAASSVLFGDGSVIRLQKDWVLTTGVQFGSAGGATDEYMVLDLNQFTIDMANAEAFIGLQGASGQVLRICNGRIINLSDDLVNGFKLAAESGTKIILENVELELAGDCTYQDAALQIEGACSFTGVKGAIFAYESMANLTIAKGSALTINDGVTYYHNNEGVTNIVCADKTATLSLIGAVFKRKSTTTNDKLALTVGTLIVDHQSTIEVGTKGVSFGDGTPAHDLSVIIHPDATIAVGGVSSGTLSYLNQD